MRGHFKQKIQIGGALYHRVYEPGNQAPAVSALCTVSPESRFDGRNEVLDRLNRYRLLILDDFGMERGTEYALEQVYNVIDSRTRSGKPLIVTTNLSLDELKNPSDTAHARIYDRVLELCVPICFTGESLRKAHAGEKMGRFRTMMRESVSAENSVNTL